MIPLGLKAKDKITGFEGIITAKITYLYGCDQYSITPEAEKGTVKDGAWFDEGRIEITGAGVLPSDVMADKPGGVHPENPRVY